MWRGAGSKELLSVVAAARFTVNQYPGRFDSRIFLNWYKERWSWHVLLCIVGLRSGPHTLWCLPCTNVPSLSGTGTRYTCH